MPIKLIALLHCKADAENTFEQELKKLMETSLLEEGCLQYQLYQYAGKRCQYVITEEWQSEEALTRHKNSPHYKHFIHIAPVLFEKPLEPIVLERLG